MKTFKLLLILVSMVITNAYAQTPGLIKGRVGAVGYTVSTNNKLIYLELPMKVELYLTEHRNLPADARYSITMNGEFAQRYDRSEILTIQNKFSGYQIAEQSRALAVKDCEVTLSDGTSVECSTPPGIGTYFSVFTSLTSKQGDRLKADLAAKKFPDVKIGTRAVKPVLKSTESIDVPLEEFYSQLRSQSDGSGITLSGLIETMVRVTGKKFQAIQSPRLVKNALALLVRECTVDHVEGLSDVTTLGDVLNKKILIKAPSTSGSSVGYDNISWEDTVRNATLEFDVLVNQGG